MIFYYDGLCVVGSNGSAVVLLPTEHGLTELQVTVPDYFTYDIFTFIYY